MNAILTVVRIFGTFSRIAVRCIKLVSIYYEHEFATGNIGYFYAPLLETEQIGEIIQAYGNPVPESSRWTELCDGARWVAHVIGWN